MARYRRIVAESFLDGPRLNVESRPIRAAVPDATGDRQRVGVFPGTALVIGPDLLPTQDRWVPASSQIVHGGASRTFAVAGANQTGPIYIADLNTLAGRAPDDSWWIGDTVPGIFWHQNRALNVLVAAGANFVKGAGMTTNARGLFVTAGAGERVIMVADETYNNTTGIHQLVRAVPAGA